MACTPTAARKLVYPAFTDAGSRNLCCTKFTPGHPADARPPDPTPRARPPPRQARPTPTRGPYVERIPSSSHRQQIQPEGYHET